MTQDSIGIEAASLPIEQEIKAQEQPSQVPSTPSIDSGLACLLMMAQFHDIVADQAKLQHEFGEAPFDHNTILLAAKSLGITARVVSQDIERLHCVNYNYS